MSQPTVPEILRQIETACANFGRRRRQLLKSDPDSKEALRLDGAMDAHWQLHQWINSPEGPA